MVSIFHHPLLHPGPSCFAPVSVNADIMVGSRGPAVLDDFTSSYGYKFSDPAGYQWGGAQADANKM